MISFLAALGLGLAVHVIQPEALRLDAKDRAQLAQALVAKAKKSKVVGDVATLPIAAIHAEDGSGVDDQCGDAALRILTAVPLASLLPKAPAGRAIVVTATECAKNSCHACGAYVGTVLADEKAATGAKGPRTWSLAGKHRITTTFGQWGKAGGPPAVVALGPGIVALRYDAGGMGQGYVSEGTTLYELAPDGGMRPVFQDAAAVSNEGVNCGEADAPPCFKLAFMVAIEGDSVHAGHYDITSSVQGTELDDKTQKLVNVSRKKTLRWDGAKYAPAGR